MLIRFSLDYSEYIHNVIANIDSYSESKNKDQVIAEVIKTIMDVLRPNETLKKHAEYSKLRKEYLTFLNKFPWYDSLTKVSMDLFSM